MRSTVAIALSIACSRLAAAQVAIEVHAPQTVLPGVRFGHAVAAAPLGSVNSDDWLIVGEPNASAGAGLVECIPPASQAVPRIVISAPSGFGQAGAHFGYAVATADINVDGHPDVLVGAPDHDLAGRADIGRVYAFFGPWMASYASWSYLEPRSTEMNLATEPGNRFGASLATGDLDGQGPIDVAVGSPQATFVTSAGARLLESGAIDLFRNVHPTSPPAALNSYAHLDDGQTSARAFDHFGASLAIGDFGNTSGGGTAPPLRDVAVGIPDNDVTFGGAVVPDFGRVRVFFGYVPTSTNKPTWDLNPPYTQSDIGYGWFGGAGAGHNHGTALAAKDYDADGWDDLVVGAPGPPMALVSMGHGSPLGLLGGWPNDVLVAPSSAGTLRFGESLAWLNRSGSSVPDLAIGALGVGGTGAVSESVYVYEGSIAPTQPLALWTNTELVVDPNPSASTNHNAFGNALIGARRGGTAFDDLTIGSPKSDSGTGARGGLVYVHTK